LGSVGAQVRRRWAATATGRLARESPGSGARGARGTPQAAGPCQKPWATFRASAWRLRARVGSARPGARPRLSATGRRARGLPSSGARSPRNSQEAPSGCQGVRRFVGAGRLESRPREPRAPAEARRQPLSGICGNLGEFPSFPWDPQCGQGTAALGARNRARARTMLARPVWRIGG
jgi:hypothetical protein